MTTVATGAYVHIESQGVGKGTTITNQDGSKVSGVKSAKIKLAIDRANIISAEITYASVDVTAFPSFHIYNPLTRETQEFKSISYEGGTTWTPRKDWVRIKSDGLLRGSAATYVDGGKIPGVTAVEINISLHEDNSAVFTLVSGKNKPFVSLHPMTGKWSNITAIEFADGSAWPRMSRESL